MNLNYLDSQFNFVSDIRDADGKIQVFATKELAAAHKAEFPNARISQQRRFKAVASHLNMGSVSYTNADGVERHEFKGYIRDEETGEKLDFKMKAGNLAYILNDQGQDPEAAREWLYENEVVGTLTLRMYNGAKVMDVSLSHLTPSSSSAAMVMLGIEEDIIDFDTVPGQATVAAQIGG